VIDAAIRSEWGDNDVADIAVSFGVTGFARQIEANLPELQRQGGIQDRFEMHDHNPRV